MAGLGEVQEEQVHTIVDDELSTHVATYHVAVDPAGEITDKVSDEVSSSAVTAPEVDPPAKVTDQLKDPSFYAQAAGVLILLIPAVGTWLSQDRITALSAFLAALATVVTVGIGGWHAWRQKNSLNARVAWKRSSDATRVELARSGAMTQLALAKEARGE